MKKHKRNPTKECLRCGKTLEKKHTEFCNNFCAKHWAYLLRGKKDYIGDNEI